MEGGGGRRRRSVGEVGVHGGDGEASESQHNPQVLN